MTFKPIAIGNTIADEVVAEGIVIRNTQDALDLMASASSDHLILHEHHFEKDFFDLSTRIAGEVLQKFTNYHVKLAIIGDFGKFESKSLKDFIYESNKRGDYLFVGSLEDVKRIWENKTI